MDIMVIVLIMASKVCEDCPLGMFNTKCKCLSGVGNPMSGMIIVVPNVDYNAYKNRGMTFSKYVEIVKETITSLTGGLEQLDPYIVPLIRCKLDDKCPVNENIIHRCMLHTFADIRMNAINKIMLLGSAANNFGFDITKGKDKLYYIAPYVYSTNYSPFIKFIDDNKYDEFRNRLVKWLTASKDNNYNGMEIIKLINDS